MANAGSEAKRTSEVPAGNLQRDYFPVEFTMVDACRLAFARLRRDTIRFVVQQENPGFWYRVTPLKIYIPVSQ